MRRMFPRPVAELMKLGLMTLAKIFENGSQTLQEDFVAEPYVVIMPSPP